MQNFRSDNRYTAEQNESLNKLAKELRKLSRRWEKKPTKEEIVDLTNEEDKLMKNYRNGNITSEKKIQSVFAEDEIPEKMLCCVCMERERNIVLMDCKHLVLCENCSTGISKCPICNKNAKEKIKIFYN